MPDEKTDGKTSTNGFFFCFVIKVFKYNSAHTVAIFLCTHTVVFLTSGCIPSLELKQIFVLQ